MNTKPTGNDAKAPKAEELTDAEMTDVSGGFFHSEKGFGVTDTTKDESGYANQEVNYVKPKSGSTGTK